MNIEKSKEMKKFIAIEYPGKVENIAKCVETLGGIEELSKGFQEKQKLQLKFRNNFYAKPVLSSEANGATGILLKVKVRKQKKHRDRPPEFVSSEMVGTVSSLYKFNSFCDYQYLPIQKNEKSGKTENIYHDLVPADITVGPSWLREKPDVPLFLPPAAFTRSDTMQPTILKNEVYNDESNDNLRFAVTNRTSRASYGISIPFTMTDPVPSEPHENAKNIVDGVLVKQEECDVVRMLFEERPIWTLASIRAHVRQPPRRLSYILATIAFYYSTGPWRNSFVAFGFDPRKNFDSRFYQMLDYRVRQGAGFKSEINWRRKTGSNKRVRVLPKFESGILQEDEIEEQHQARWKEAIFTHDTIPPFRARHYQLVDVHIPKIQEMLHKIPSPMSGGICNEKRGWMPVGFLENCRDILTEIAQANMLKLCNEKNISLEELKNVKLEPSVGEEEEDEEEAAASDSDGSENNFLDDADEPLEPEMELDD